MIEEGNPPSRVGNVLQDLLCKFGIDSKIKQLHILKLWSKVVGESLSKHSQPVSISKGNLFVKVDNSAWLNQISYFKEKIIAEFNKIQGEIVVKRIYFRVGSISVPQKHTSKRKKRKVKLDQKELEWVHKTVTQIEDDDLKKTIERILLQYKKAQKAKESQNQSSN